MVAALLSCVWTSPLTPSLLLQMLLTKTLLTSFVHLLITQLFKTLSNRQLSCSVPGQLCWRHNHYYRCWWQKHCSQAFVLLLVSQPFYTLYGSSSPVLYLDISADCTVVSTGAVNRNIVNELQFSCLFHSCFTHRPVAVILSCTWTSVDCTIITTGAVDKNIVKRLCSLACFTVVSHTAQRQISCPVSGSLCWLSTNKLHFSCLFHSCFTHCMAAAPLSCVWTSPPTPQSSPQVLPTKTSNSGVLISAI